MKNSMTIEIQITDLYKSFNDEKVLEGVNLSIMTGEMIAIVGGSGCGKTVLFNTILGQYPVDNGKILVNDRTHGSGDLKDITSFNNLEIDDIHKHWGVVFQKNALFSGTVYKNIALWLYEVKGLDDDAILPIAQSALRDVGLPYDQDFLDTAQSDLSGGMAKRLAIARAIAMDPYVIFYDEPTTGLDPSSSEQIYKLIQKTHNTKLHDGSSRTSLIITHDKDLLSQLRPRIAMLHQGKIYFDGPFEDFENADSDIIRPYFELMPILDQRYMEDIPKIPEPNNRRGILM